MQDNTSIKSLNQLLNDSGTKEYQTKSSEAYLLLSIYGLLGVEVNDKKTKVPQAAKKWVSYIKVTGKPL